MPRARQLAPHKLQRYKKGKNMGKFKEKSLNLASGSVSFRKAGGYFIHDKEELRRYVLDNLVACRDFVTYDRESVIARLEAGTLKNIPGTGEKPEDQLAVCKVKLPGARNDEEVPF